MSMRVEADCGVRSRCRGGSIRHCGASVGRSCAAPAVDGIRQVRKAGGFRCPDQDLIGRGSGAEGRHEGVRLRPYRHGIACGGVRGGSRIGASSEILLGEGSDARRGRDEVTGCASDIRGEG